MQHKRELQPSYIRLRLDPWLAGTAPAFANAVVFKELLSRYPEMLGDLLLVRESLFSTKPNHRRFPNVSGETVFGIKAWDEKLLQSALADASGHTGGGFEILGPAEGFVPGHFSRLHLDTYLPTQFFPKPRIRLEEYLRSAYLPYSLRRENDGYRFDLPKKALKKRLLYEGTIQPTQSGLLASLDVGVKFDLGALIATFGSPELARHASVQVSAIEW
jgi:hypothetical protein